MTVTGTSAGEGVEGAPAASEPSGSTSTPNGGVLRLRGRTLNTAKVQWEEDVVDNEFMGKKKSKICCIYHKPKEFDESSDEDSDSSCGSNDSRVQHRHSQPHDCNDRSAAGSTGGGGGGSTAARSGGGSTTETVQRAPTPPPPNAYERQGGSGKGKGKA